LTLLTVLTFRVDLTIMAVALGSEMSVISEPPNFGNSPLQTKHDSTNCTKLTWHQYTSASPKVLRSYLRSSNPAWKSGLSREWFGSWMLRDGSLRLIFTDPGISASYDPVTATTTYARTSVTAASYRTHTVVWTSANAASSYALQFTCLPSRDCRMGG
jgi:hypothetical protein